jgi:putative hydrolase of the HAD superfamily
MDEGVKGEGRYQPVGDPPGHEGKCAADVILFDFGGVLAEEGFAGGLAAIARKNGIDERAFVDLGHELVHKTGFVTGHAEEAVYWKTLRLKAGIRGRDEDLRKEILSRFKLRPWLFRIVRTIREKGTRVGILSDQTLWLDELNGQQDFFKYFDYVFNSYHLGKSKADPTHFNDITGILRVKPERVLFVDDNEGHVGRAKLRGWKTILYSDRETFIIDIKKFCPYIENSV